MPEQFRLNTVNFTFVLLFFANANLAKYIEEVEEPLTVLEPAPFVPANTIAQTSQPFGTVPSQIVSSETTTEAMPEPTGNNGNEEGLRSVVYYVNWVCFLLYLDTTR